MYLIQVFPYIAAMHFLLISTTENCLLKQISLIATLINILGSFTQENEIMHPF